MVNVWNSRAVLKRFIYESFKGEGHANYSFYPTPECAAFEVIAFHWESLKPPC
jgi:hypothetical protein